MVLIGHQTQTWNREEEKSQRKGNKETLPVVTGLKAELKVGDRQRTGKTATCLCSPRRSGFLKILLFSSFKLLKIYDIPPTYFRVEKRHNESYCFHRQSLTLSNIFRRRKKATRWFMFSLLLVWSPGFPSKNIICILLLNNITFKEIFSYSIELVFWKYSWPKITIEKKNLFNHRIIKVSQSFYPELWSSRCFGIV